MAPDDMAPDATGTDDAVPDGAVRDDAVRDGAGVDCLGSRPALAAGAAAPRSPVRESPAVVAAAPGPTRAGPATGRLPGEDAATRRAIRSVAPATREAPPGAESERGPTSPGGSPAVRRGRLIAPTGVGEDPSAVRASSATRSERSGEVGDAGEIGAAGAAGAPGATGPVGIGAVTGPTGRSARATVSDGVKRVPATEPVVTERALGSCCQGAVRPDRPLAGRPGRGPRPPDGVGRVGLGAGPLRGARGRDSPPPPTPDTAWRNSGCSGTGADWERRRRADAPGAVSRPVGVWRRPMAERNPRGGAVGRGLANADCWAMMRSRVASPVRGRTGGRNDSSHSAGGATGRPSTDMSGTARPSARRVDSDTPLVPAKDALRRPSAPGSPSAPSAVMAGRRARRGRCRSARPSPRLPTAGSSDPGSWAVGSSVMASCSPGSRGGRTRAPRRGSRSPRTRTGVPSTGRGTPLRTPTPAGPRRPSGSS